DQPQPAAVRSIQISPPAMRPSSPRGRLPTCTATLTRLLRLAGSMPAARQALMPCVRAACSCSAGTPAVTAPSPAEAASRECRSTTVMRTSLEVIGGMPSACTVAVLGSSNLQVLKAPITKSDRVASSLWEERVSAMKLEKQPPRPRAVRSTPSSRNSPAAGLVRWLLSVKDQGTETDPEFTIAKGVVPGAETGSRWPVVSSPVQRKTVIVETEPPTVKSLTSRMSPSLWVPVNGLPLEVGLLVLRPTGFWKNQKPAVASPLLSKRSSPANRS